MRVLAFEDKKSASEYGVQIVAKALVKNPKIILGLATGSTPLDLYADLIRYYQQKRISFHEATAINLDEYIGLGADHPQSYAYFMKKHLFDHVDFKEENTYIPSGIAKDLEAECHSYDQMIADKGGIDIQILGIGQNGHIGFNEPADHFAAKTHLVDLDPGTCKANSRFFRKEEDVPTRAVSIGIKSIFQAREILLLALGENKAKAVKEMIEGPISPKLPASILQLHQHTTILMDMKAATALEKRSYELVSKK